MALSIFSSVQHLKVGQLITGVNLNSLVHTGKCGKAPLENSDRHSILPTPHTPSENTENS